MPNQLNKNKNKLKEKDEIRSAQEILISKQQAEHRWRFQQIVDDEGAQTEETEKCRGIVGTTSTTKELGGGNEERSTLREENPDRRELARTAQSAEGARAWSELFIDDILPRWRNED